MALTSQAVRVLLANHSRLEVQLHRSWTVFCHSKRFADDEISLYSANMWSPVAAGRHGKRKHSWYEGMETRQLQWP